MKTIWVAVLASTILWLGMFDTALALQCHGNVVSLGYSTWRVREICGEPVDVRDTQLIVTRRAGHPYKGTPVEIVELIHQSVWTYNFGSTRLVYILTFHNDKLVNIETEWYGR
jgi:hypothetical protein